MVEYGLRHLTGTFAFGILTGKTAIRALITHCILFRGKDIWYSYKSARQGRYSDCHHQHMAAHYGEAQWWWYIIILMISFALLIVF
jgi:hypothetical protein